MRVSREPVSRRSRLGAVVLLAGGAMAGGCGAADSEPTPTATPAATPTLPEARAPSAPAPPADAPPDETGR